MDQLTGQSVDYHDRSVAPAGKYKNIFMIDHIGCAVGCICFVVPNNFSGTGMDTNVIGRKLNDHGHRDEIPFLHHIYVRGLTPATHGNATGLGIAELCHRRVIEATDMQLVRMNCITAGHVTAAMIPIDFPNDSEALKIGCQMAGYKEPHQVSVQWIVDTLHLEQVECSEAYYAHARQRSDLEVLTEPTALQFDSQGDLLPRF